MSDIEVRIPAGFPKISEACIKEALQAVCPGNLTGSGDPSESIEISDLRIKITRRDEEDPNETDWADVAVVIKTPNYANVVADASGIAQRVERAVTAFLVLGFLFVPLPSVGVWVQPVQGGFAFRPRG